MLKKPKALRNPCKDLAKKLCAHSAARNEPEWMLEFRLNAWRQFEQMPWPQPTDESWRRTRLTGFDLNHFKPLAVATGQVEKGELSKFLQDELNEMDSAASMVFEDSGLRNKILNTNLDEHGVIFTDLQSAVLEHPELVRKYFMTEAVKPELNKFTALHAALWDTGAFVYVPARARDIAASGDPEPVHAGCRRLPSYAGCHRRRR